VQLSLQTFTSLIQNMAASVQSAASQILDLGVGSTTRAILEASASIALWMQWLILQVLQATRAATSTGSDLDSWMNDFSLKRLRASPASGIVTFSRFTPTSVGFIPVGTTVRTADLSQTFLVVGAASIPAFSSTQDGYVLVAGTSSLDVPVTAMSPGSAGNVQAGSVTLLGTAVPGVDQVTNSAAFQGGLDAESDDAFRSRFQSFMASRSRATPAAIGFAVQSIQQGLIYAIQENVDQTGNPALGNFVVTVDDGTGYPSVALLASVQSAVDAVRPIGSTFSVQAPGVVYANVSLTVAFGSITSSQAVISAVTAGLTNFINALTLGSSLPLTKIAQVAYQSYPAVTNVSQILINGTENDLAAGPSQVIKCGLVVVT
jgi:uncharacterized phage protein gp47/JayE